MAQYEKYRKIDLPWLKSIPFGWKWVRNKFFFKESKEIVGSSADNFTLLSLTLNGVIVRDFSEKIGKLPENFEKYKIVYPNDIVFCLFDMDETPRTVGLSHNKGMITGAYDIFHVQSINAQYVYYYYLSLDNEKVLRPLYTGLRKTIKTNTFLSLKMPVPPREEQDQIVRFLDWKISEINKLIAIRKKEIQELINLKDAVVSYLVIRGNKKKIKMKDSGVNWIGKIPSTWKIIKLRQILTPLNERNQPKLPLLSVVRDKGIIIRDIEKRESNHNYIPDDLSNYKVVHQNQFAINKMKAWQGSYGVSSYTGIVSPAYFVFNVNFDNLEYFHFAIRSKVYINFFAQASDGIRIGQWDLQMDKMKEIPFIVPSYEEQLEIVKIAKRNEKKCENEIRVLNNEISRLQELRSTIISDVVTGKIDVRNIPIPEYEHIDDAIVHTSEDGESEAEERGE